MSKYTGLYTFDVDNHRYIPVGQSDGIVDCFNFNHHESTEPLIKDEKIRKAVRAWAEALGNRSAFVEKSNFESNRLIITNGPAEISFNIELPENLEPLERYTIEELCGEEEE